MGMFSTKRNSAGLLAISIAADGLCSASISRQLGSKPVLQFLSYYPLSNKSVPELLDRLAKDAHAKSYQCSLLLARGEYQVFSVDALNVPTSEVKSAMRWRLKELLDYPATDATIDVLDVAGEGGTGARNHTMFAIAARNTVIEARQLACKVAGLPLSIIDIPDMAQRNISALLEQEGRGLAMLSFDAAGGLLTVSFGGELYLSRHFDVRLDQIRSSNDEQRAAVFERVTLELQRSLDHFDRQHHTINTSKLILALSGAVALELQAYLSANLYLPTELLQLDQVIDFSKIPELKDPARQQVCLMALGAALRDAGAAA